MSILVKIAVGVGAAILAVAVVCVIIAALFPPKEYKGDGRVSVDGDKRDD